MQKILGLGQFIYSLPHMGDAPSVKKEELGDGVLQQVWERKLLVLFGLEDYSKNGNYAIYVRHYSLLLTLR